MKKKWIVLALCMTLCMLITACASSNDGGNQQQTDDSATDSSTENDQQATDGQQVQETEDGEEDAPEEEKSSAATLGDYEVEIKSASIVQDYEGNPAIVVTYSWTNNSEDTTSAITSVSCSAFQSGVGLETAIIMDDSAYDSDSFMTEVRPGTTIDVQAAFVLNDKTSIVEVEIGEWITLEDDPTIAYMEFDPTAL